jgi:hypothetical protein
MCFCAITARTWNVVANRAWTKDREIKSAGVFVGDVGYGPWQNQESQAFLDQFVKRESPVIPVVALDVRESSLRRFPNRFTTSEATDLGHHRPKASATVAVNLANRQELTKLPQTGKASNAFEPISTFWLAD